MLTPMDIHNKDFKKSFRGYDADQVDDFLDQVVNDYERVFQENDQLKKDLALEKKAAKDYLAREQTIKDTLVMAQKTAEEVTRNAKERAEALKESTAKECQNMKKKTELECLEEQKRVHHKAQMKLDEAAEKARKIIAEYDRLVHEKRDFLLKVRTALSQQLAVIEGTMQELPLPDDLAGALSDEQEAEVSPSTAEENAEQDSKGKKVEQGKTESMPAGVQPARAIVPPAAAYDSVQQALAKHDAAKEEERSR